MLIESATPSSKFAEFRHKIIDITFKEILRSSSDFGSFVVCRDIFMLYNNVLNRYNVITNLFYIVIELLEK